ncbi:S-adenosyl-L-methionine-dependent methyltransferase [Ilyonectria robusta]|uniref:S-adenosyl-L-methionine-dependent methyltransferase n=1 Tax=Ilyonectria robusta TaxID=1079257 RepID=UPI001E8E187A|nr:S-adenosyl-L-methionine-dependent methyltransferase [Ilyonectria robusta]KAH8684951.1 S-adenosyl-L-methionine-dependent methyltransferase [Ilyonectria robusta]
MAEAEPEAPPISRESESPRQDALTDPEASTPQQQSIDVDDTPADDGYVSDSGSGSSVSTSLSSSVRDYRFENSRRYHRFKEGLYQFPNDTPEQEREDMKHTVAVHLLGGKLHNAPLDNPQRILDIGTGTGSWANDAGDEYPAAEVTGIDLSPIQSPWVPPNVKFLVDDAEAEWLYRPDSLDLIHLRNMSTAIKDWPALFAQAYRTLKPGGWIELPEFRWVYGCDDGTMHPDYTPPQMVANIRDGLATFGIDMHASEKNEDRLRDAGFVNVRHEIKKVPVGPWPKDSNLKKIGLYNRSVIYDGLQAITMGPFTRGLGWKPEEVEVFLVKVRKDLMDTSVHSYVHFHSLCAQKPENLS